MKTETKTNWNIWVRAAMMLLVMVLTVSTAWAQTQYSINTYLSPTTGGSITISGNKTSAAENTSITFTVNPNNGYMVESVTVREVNSMQAITDLQENAVSGQGTARSYTFSMPASPVIIEAKFTANLNVQTAVTPSGTGTASYNATTHQVIAIPAEGYVFKQWNYSSDGITGTNNISTANPYTVNQSGTYTAVFEEGTYSGTTQSCAYVDENGNSQTVTAYLFDNNVLASQCEASIGAVGLTMWLCDVSIGPGQTLNLYGNIRVISLNIEDGGTLNINDNSSLTVYGQGYGTQPNLTRGVINNYGTMTINGSSFCLLGTISNKGTFNVNNAQFMIDFGASLTHGTCRINVEKGGYFFRGGTYTPDASTENGNVKLSFYRNGKWNTLCLPFALGDENAADGHHLDYTPLAGATLMELDTETAYNGHQTGISNGTLYLNFKPATCIEACKPYIVKWPGNESIIENFIFNSYSAIPPTEVSFPGGKFLGTFSFINFDQTDKSVLFLGAANTLYYPQSGASINACHAYFQLNDGITAGDSGAGVRAFRLNFGDGDEATGIREITDPTPDPSPAWEGSGCAWYDLSGRKLDGKPAAKGIYIHDGRKIVVK